METGVISLCSCWIVEQNHWVNLNVNKCIVLQIFTDANKYMKLLFSNSFTKLIKGA